MDLDDAKAHCLSLPGAAETYPFGDEVAVIKVAGRMFALLSVNANPASISLKCDPDLAVVLRGQYPKAVTSGYHLNKRHWNSIRLDDTVPDDELRDWIEDSWELVVAGLPKREQAPLTSQRR